MNGRASTSRTPTGSLPNAHSRQPGSRSHSHSLSVGSLNPLHRVDRRRKSTSSNNNVAAAAVLGLVAEQLREGSGASARHVKRSVTKPSPASYATSLPADNGFGQSTFDSKASSAIVDDPRLATLPESGEVKLRARRASDGSRLVKGEGKRQTHGELRCEHCGKGYKHSSCLYKHLWEHTPEWAITSKLLISKHQQVQLLEAASVLVQMNQNVIESDTSSPDMSSSELTSDGASSKADSPPPFEQSTTTSLHDSKRFSSNSSIYSRSYQSSLFSDGLQYNMHSRQLSSDNQPITSNTSVASVTDEDREEMSAAFNLLSCSLGTIPKSGSSALSRDIPPVPPLPAKYLGQSIDHLSGSTITGITDANSSFVRNRTRPDVEMVDDDPLAGNAIQTDDEDDEEGMFGRMEE